MWFTRPTVGRTVNICYGQHSYRSKEADKVASSSGHSQFFNVTRVFLRVISNIEKLGVTREEASDKVRSSITDMSIVNKFYLMSSLVYHYR